MLRAILSAAYKISKYIDKDTDIPQLLKEITRKTATVLIDLNLMKTKIIDILIFFAQKSIKSKKPCYICI